MKKAFLSLLLLPSLLFSFADPLVLDRHFSPHAASYDFLYLENEIIGLENRYKDYRHAKKQSKFEKRFKAAHPDLALPNLPPPSLGKRILGRFLRWMELDLFWSPLNEMASTTQHEVFGHGYRIRDLGRRKVEVVGYQVDLPFPYGLGGGATHYIDHSGLSTSETLLIDIAGTEASSILAHKAALSWLTKNKVDGREASLFLKSNLDLPTYILLQKNPKKVHESYLEGEGDDISNYLINLNLLYPSNKSFSLQLESLKTRALASYLGNPFLYYGIAAHLKYIWSGRPIQITSSDAPIRFLMPGYRLSLSPFGPEDVFMGYLLLKSKDPSYFYYKEGRFSRNRYQGFGFENPGLLRLGSSLLGLKLDFWNQPSILQHTPHDHEPYSYTETVYFPSEDDVYFVHSDNKYSDEDLYDKHFGFAGSLIYRYEFAAKRANTLFTQLGYKTKGFLPGESIHSGVIFRFGMNLIF